MSDEEKNVTIDGNKYRLEDLSERAQYVLSQIQEIQGLLNDKRREVDRHAMSLDAFNAVLKKEIEETPIEADSDG